MIGIIIGIFMVAVLLVVGWTCLRGKRAREELAARYPPPGRLVDVGSYRLHINCQGVTVDGSPTVVMEAAEFSLTWSLVQPKMAEFTRVCAYDRAGLGWSEPSPKPRTAPNIVEELHTLLIEAGVEPPYVLVGHSKGGMYARLYAHEHPDQVAGIVLVDAAHEEQESRFPLAVAQLNRKGRKQMVWLLRLAGLLNSIGLLALLRDCLPPQFLATMPAEAREVCLDVLLSDTKFFKAAADETASLDQDFALVRAAQITTLGDIPLIALWAPDQFADLKPHVPAEDTDHMKALVQEMQAELSALSSNGRQMMARESGHYIQVDQPDLVVDAIRQVVDQARH
jgi:pimeloyl-ACP methyl ester carboxylesterase